MNVKGKGSHNQHSELFFFLLTDQSKGQLVRTFTISAAHSNGATTWVTASGTSIGNKFIQVLIIPLTDVASITLNITGTASDGPAGRPFIKNFAVFSCSGLARQLDDEWAAQHQTVDKHVSPPALDLEVQRPWLLPPHPALAEQASHAAL